MFLTFLFIVYEFVDKCSGKCLTCVSSVRNQKWNLTPAPMLSVDIPVRLLCSVASLVYFPVLFFIIKVCCVLCFFYDTMCVFLFLSYI